jgi:hypothetical protein
MVLSLPRRLRSEGKLRFMTAIAAILLKPRASRLPVSIRTGILDEDGRPVPVKIVNITIYGFMAETAAAVSPGELIGLALPDETMTAEVRWADGRRFGAQFTPPIRTATLARLLSRWSA